MKAKELMIGDWVWTSGHPVQIETIRRRKVSYLKQYYKEFEFLTPIILTEEILEANGFDIIQDGDSLTIWKQKDDEYGNEVYDITIYASKDVTRFDTSIRYCGAIRKNIYYVHELQHALRLCELDDLADNFKVN